MKISWTLFALPIILLNASSAHLQVPCPPNSPCEGEVSKQSEEFYDVCSLYDLKDVNIEEGWNASHLEMVDASVSAEGQLTMMPWTTAWYADYRSNLLFKEVSGNFVASTYVTAHNRADNDMPGAQYSLAGIMIRQPKTMIDGLNDWTTGEENYIFLSLGFASTGHPSCSGCPGPHFEVKNTTNSNSNLAISSLDTAAAEIRLIRIDEDVLVLYRLPGGGFVVHQRYERFDFPDTMQVGLVTYTDWDKVSTYTQPFHNSHTLNDSLNPDPSSDPLLPFDPDLIGRFDYLRFDSLAVPPELDGLDFSDPAAVSDSVVLSLFSYDSLPQKNTENWKIWRGTDSDWNNTANWSGNSLPTLQDSILIPNCGCAEVNFPVINSGSYEYASLCLDPGGSMTIAAGVQFTIDLSGPQARFINEGSLINHGTFVVSNADGRLILNRGQFENQGGGSAEIRH